MVYVAAPPLPLAQCHRNCVGDPISPASGALYETEVDLGGTLQFKRFYSSASANSSDLPAGWRHSFSRSIQARYAGTSYGGGYTPNAYNSSLYADEDKACTLGFAQIKGQVSTWSNATASYANGICTLKVGSTQIGTLPILYNNPPTPDPSTLQLVGYDANRDDGQVVSFLLQGGAVVAPPSINLRLQTTQGGFSLTDESDNVETYGSTGKLLSVTSRAGVTQTLAYDSSGHLSTVTDSFGHTLSLSYDSQGRLSSVTQQ